MTERKNKHDVTAKCRDGALSDLEWTHRGEQARLVRVQEGWVMIIGKHAYQLTLPATPSDAVYKDDTGEYMAKTVKPNKHYTSEANTVVIIEGEGQVLIDSDVLESKASSIKKAGKEYRDGDIITVGGRRARVAVGQTI